MIIAPNAENGEAVGSKGRELRCTWLTPQTINQSPDVQNFGGIGLGIEHDSSYTEDAYAALGWNIDDPRLHAADAWALTAGGNYQGSEPVGASSVQVVRNGTV